MFGTLLICSSRFEKGSLFWYYTLFFINVQWFCEKNLKFISRLFVWRGAEGADLADKMREAYREARGVNSHVSVLNTLFWCGKVCGTAAFGGVRDVRFLCDVGSLRELGGVADRGAVLR